MTLLHKPIITEKSMRLAQNGLYTFRVERMASKHEIANAVHEQFNVDVEDVKTITMHGKMKRVGRTRQMIKKARAWKKAIVKLKKDQKIEVFNIS